MDTTTANGRLDANVVLSVCEWQSDVQGEVSRETLAHLRSEGWRFGSHYTDGAGAPAP